MYGSICGSSLWRRPSGLAIRPAMPRFVGAFLPCRRHIVLRQPAPTGCILCLSRHPVLIAVAVSRSVPWAAVSKHKRLQPESASGCPQSSENAVFWTFAVRRATSSRRRRNHRSDHPTSCAEAKYLVSRREIDGTLPLERQGSVFGNHREVNQTELVPT
jgi:hypothetical protein